MSECRSFPPLIDTSCRILILGSMPGRESLAQQQYYAHPQNRFWRLLARLLDAPQPCTYPEKQKLLLGHAIALWDVLAFCEREGSLDTAIRNEQPNDILGLLHSYPGLRAIFCNGGKAAATLKKQWGRLLPPELPVYQLPSTSPANARKRLQDLEQDWQLILSYLK